MADFDAGFLDRLARALRDGRASLAPEVLLVGSNLLGQDIARRIREVDGGWANLRIFTLIDLARLLAREGFRPSVRLLDAPVRLGLAREALRGFGDGIDRASLGILSARQGLPVALAALFDDCMDAAAAELPPEPPPGIDAGRWRILRRLYADWRGRLGAHVVHPAQVIELGAAHASRFTELLGCRRLWMAGFYDLTANQESLIEALARAGVGIVASLPRPVDRWGDFALRFQDFLGKIGAETIAAAKGDSEGPSTALSRLRAKFFAAAPDGAAIPLANGDESLQVVSAPDEEREVREAAREVIRLFETRGVAFDRVAVTFPAGKRDEYLALAEEIFPAAGIPVAGRPFGSLARETDGRALRALLSLLGLREIPRHRLLDLLSFDAAAAALTPGLPPGAMERLSRIGGLALWSGDWDRRLRAAARPRSLDREDLEEPPADDLPANAALDDAIDKLRAFLNLAGAFPRRGAWPDLLVALDGLLAIALPSLVSSPEVRRIARVLRDLAGVEPGTSIEVFRAAWEDELRSAPPASPAPAGTGVRIGDVIELRGLVFDAVFALGVAEGSFPAPPAVEPLLPDEARRALARHGLHLAVKGERGAEEKLLFASCVASAGRFLRVSFHRSASQGGRRILPSVFFLEAASLLAGERLGALDVERLDAVCHRVDLAHGAHGLDRSLDAAEFDVAAAVEASAGRWSPSAVREAFAAVNPHALRLATFEETKWQRPPRPSDGLVRRELLKRIPTARLFGRRGVISASKVETFAACPHRYLLQYVLGLDSAEDPEERFEIGPLERGLLAHRILERTYKTFQKEGLLPLGHEKLARAEEILRRIAEEECDRSAARVAVGLPALWMLRRDQLIESLLGVVRDDAEEKGEWIPHSFEMVFGGPTGVLLELPPNVGDAKPAAISFRGKIDRVDVRSDGRAVRVIDYKSGKRPSVGREDPFNAGELIQLPVYLLAAASRIAHERGPIEIEESQGVYRSFGEGKSVFPALSRETLLARLQSIAAEVAREIDAGEFFPTPRSRRSQCERCAFKHVCDPRVEAIAELKGFANRLGIRGEGSEAEPDAAD